MPQWFRVIVWLADKEGWKEKGRLIDDFNFRERAF